MSALPTSARLAWWGTAWLGGLVGPDELIDGVFGGPEDPDRDVRHLVATRDASEPLLLALAGARGRGAIGVAAAFPTAGDPGGLRGGRELSAAAIDAGEAVLLLGAQVAWVPVRVGRAVEWAALPCERRPPIDVGEADRALRAALLTAVGQLSELDVASWRPEVADELHDLRARVPIVAPPGVPARCVDLAGRALHLESVVDLALDDETGTVSASQAEARRAALLPLGRAARQALAAACSPDGWPPPADRHRGDSLQPR